jgi:DNA-binding FadR family transcriptional regulator
VGIAQLKPLKAASLKEIFIERFEGLILSGELVIGEQLPSERELADQLGVSRPVVHEGLVELANRGLVTLRPRIGAIVSDYRRQGSLSLLESLLGHGSGRFDPALRQSLLNLRRLVETDAALRAAERRSEEELRELEGVVARELRAADGDDWVAIVVLDFELHHRVALASGDPVYPMLLKSCEPAYKNLSGQFFRRPGVVPVVHGLHRELVAAITAGDGDAARRTMERLLDHGQIELERANDRVGAATGPALVEGESR